MRVNQKIGNACLVLLLAGFALQCQPSSDPDSSGSGGRAAVSVTIQSLSSLDVARIRVTVTGPDIAPPIGFDLVASGSAWSGVIGGLPSGMNRTFTAEAFDATDALIYRGSVTSVLITPGNTAVVLLVLQQATPPDPFTNTPPLIDSVVASAAVVPPGGQVAVEVRAHDDDGDPLTFAWTATGGTFSAAASTSPLWTAPTAEGIYTLAIAVRDTKDAVRQVSFNIRVRAAAATGSADVEATVNTWPTVQGVTATPPRIRAGQTTSLAVAATDADGQALSYAWSDGGGDCTGAFSAPGAATSTWTAPTANPVAGRCMLTVTITDGAGGSNTGRIVVFVDNLETINFAPSFAGTFQSATSAVPGATVTLGVIGSDPEDEPLTFSWTAAAGTLSAPTSDATRSRIVWTAPFICAPVAITVTVTDPFGSFTRHTFTVAACPASCSPYPIQENGADICTASYPDNFIPYTSPAIHSAVPGGCGGAASTVGIGYSSFPNVVFKNTNAADVQLGDPIAVTYTGWASGSTGSIQVAVDVSPDGVLFFPCGTAAAANYLGGAVRTVTCASPFASQSLFVKLSTTTLSPALIFLRTMQADLSAACP